jgi:magnesium-transporting ATPase (P-type)
MEPLWLVMILSALISWFISIAVTRFQNFTANTGEVISILLAALGLISVTAVADWIKDNRFVNLQSLIKEDNVTVIRGKSGACSTISIWELVVGDIILLNTGA